MARTGATGQGGHTFALGLSPLLDLKAGWGKRIIHSLFIQLPPAIKHVSRSSGKLGKKPSFLGAFKYKIKPNIKIENRPRKI